MGSDNFTEQNVFHVKDWEVWAAIHYLDSSTDFREYLSSKDPEQKPGQLIMLDDADVFWKVAKVVPFVVIALICIVVYGYLYYMFINTL